jgi:hypothetical protein
MTKTVLPLPRYVRRKWLRGAQCWGYFFEPPTWARHPSFERGPCPVGAEELGTDYAPAHRRGGQLRGIAPGCGHRRCLGHAVARDRHNAHFRTAPAPGAYL